MGNNHEIMGEIINQKSLNYTHIYAYMHTYMYIYICIYIYSVCVCIGSREPGVAAVVA